MSPVHDWYVLDKFITFNPRIPRRSIKTRIVQPLENNLRGTVQFGSCNPAPSRQHQGQSTRTFPSICQSGAKPFLDISSNSPQSHLDCMYSWVWAVWYTARLTPRRKLDPACVLAARPAAVKTCDGSCRPRVGCRIRNDIMKQLSCEPHQTT